MSTTRAPWREVVSHRIYQTRNHARGSYSLQLTLSCGHEVHRKASQGTPRRTRCSRCPTTATATSVDVSNLGDPKNVPQIARRPAEALTLDTLTDDRIRAFRDSPQATPSLQWECDIALRDPRMKNRAHKTKVRVQGARQRICDVINLVVSAQCPSCGANQTDDEGACVHCKTMYRTKGVQ